MSKTKQARKAAERLLERNLREQRRIIDWDVADLKTAADYYYRGDGVRAGKVFFPLMKRLIVEPLKDTKEYQDGERKQALPVEEQEEAEVSGKRTVLTFDDLFRDDSRERNPNAPSPETEERDEDGYLIR